MRIEPGNIICHAPGDICYGCDHYKGEADECLYAKDEKPSSEMDFSTFRWPFGQRVRKTKGSSWQGRIVGFYCTELTPEGYAVESERERGSVQIYPVGALEVVEGDET